MDFVFPPNITVASGGYLLVVSFDPVNDTNSLAGFRAAYPQLAPTTALFGPYQGKLDNGGERLGLYKPRAPIPAGQPGAGIVPYVLVEAVNYDDVAPWSPLADGTGNSLQRTDPALYGNDAGHWVAGTPTPGPVNTEPDSDGDGIPDSWMNQYFGHPTGQAGDNSLAGQDADGDGMSNLQEYIAGTHPLNASSVLRLLVAQPVPGSANLQLSFVAQANQAYSIYYTDQLNPMVWNWVADVAPSSTTQTVIVPVTGVGQKRFFRVVTQ